MPNARLPDLDATKGPRDTLPAPPESWSGLGRGLQTFVEDPVGRWVVGGFVAVLFYRLVLPSGGGLRPKEGFAPPDRAEDANDRIDG